MIGTNTNKIPNVPIPNGLLSVEAAKCAALCAMLDNPILL